MSHDYYNELWLVARSDLEKLLDFDNFLQKARRIKDRNAALHHTLMLYIRYRDLVRRLVICHNQMVHTQKRELIKRVADCAAGRMLECKREIVRLDCSYYQWPDDILYQLKLVPDNLDTPCLISSGNRLKDRREYIEKIQKAEYEASIRERSLSQVVASMMDIGESSSKMLLTRRRRHRQDPSQTILTETPQQKAAREAREAREAAQKAMYEAVLLIQSHERARVGRSAATQVQMMYDYRRKVESGEIEPTRRFSKTTYITAIVMMQRAYRKFAARKAERRRAERLEETLDMTIPSWKPQDIQKKDEERFWRRQELMPANAAQTERAVHDERARLFKVVGPGLVEDITDEIHEWFIVWYNTMGHFDVYPPAQLGGSVLIATGETIDPEEYLIRQIAQEKFKKRGGKLDLPKSMIEQKRPTSSPLPTTGWTMPTSRAFASLEEANKDFIENWSFRDDSSNPSQHPYLDLITDKLCYELQLETRQIVDELMRLELEKLNEALLKDHASDRPKYKIPKLPGSKRAPKKKPRRRKERKDRFASIPVENLFRELVQAGIIRNYPERRLNDWFGDLSYQNYEAAIESREHYHRLGEIKQIVMDYCVLPISSKELHAIAPLTRSVCICGLPGYGKNFLVDAICSEVGALLFDMTPAVLVDKYKGKKMERRLMDIIRKLSRAYAPSVVFIDGGEKPWVRKISKDERQYLKPARFAKHHTKFVKGIRPGDQVLFLTVSSEPYNAKGPFMKIHNVFIIIPLTDYNTLYMYYKHMLMKYHGVDRNLNVSCMAKMSVGIPLEFIREAIERVMSLERRLILKIRPLTQLEIMEEVWKYEPLAAKTLQKYQKFESKTPLGKKKERLLIRIRKEAERQAALQTMLAKKR